MTTTPAILETHSDDKRKELVAREKFILRYLPSALHVGQLLLRIKEEGLYKVTHKKFGVYLEERWRISRLSGHSLITAAMEARAIKSRPGLPTPNAESQVRPVSGSVQSGNPRQ